MKLMFELSKEQKSLPATEVLSCLAAEDITFQGVESNEDVLIVQTDVDEAVIVRLAERLGFTFLIDELLFSCPTTLDAIKQGMVYHPLKKEGSIAIRCKNRSSTIESQQLIDLLGDVYTKRRAVDLRHPEIEIRAVVTDTTTYVGMKKAEVHTRHFQQRRAQFRPFTSPITLHPKLARALVNLSGIKKNETLLDPFCGTGGILLEAGLIGAYSIGSDIEQKMIDGCKKTFEFYNIKDVQLYRCDIGEIHQFVGSVDAVVTDFPYGKSTTTKGEQITTLYDRAFSAISSRLKKNGRAVVGLSNKEMIAVGENHLQLLEVHAFRVHKSMTRYFVVYRKKP